MIQGERGYRKYDRKHRRRIQLQETDKRIYQIVRFLDDFHAFLNLEVTETLFTTRDSSLTPITRFFEKDTEFAKCRSCAGLRRYIEVKTPVRGTTFAGNDTAEIIAGETGLLDALWC
jgi:hypothetical protein